MDANISEIIVVLDRAFEENLAGAVEMLTAAGMAICSADDDKSVVEGQIETEKVHALEKLACVDYVRKVFSYDANYPPGHPGDRDGV